MSAARNAAAFVSGLVFSIGLGVAGMTRPSKVLGFLDVAGDWDPSLAFVMGAALVVYFLAARLVGRRARPFFDAALHLPDRRAVDAPLVAGAILFGVGWGLAGYCPGPALVASTTLGRDALVFTATMVAAMFVHDLAGRTARGRTAATG